MLLYHVYATNLNTSVHVALHVSGTISLVEIKVQRVVNPIMAAPTVQLLRNMQKDTTVNL